MNTALTTVLALALGSSLAASEKVAERTPSLRPEYNHRIVAIQPSVSYERIAKDSVYFGFESHITPAYRTDVKDGTILSMTELKTGYNFEVDTTLSITPIVGISVFRDLATATTLIGWDTDLGKPTDFEVVLSKCPYLVQGFVGLGMDYSISKSFSFGLNMKALAGKCIVDGAYGTQPMQYTLNASIPMTFRFGEAYRWDFRLDPYAYAHKDAAKYVGLKAGVGYRF